MSFFGCPFKLLINPGLVKDHMLDAFSFPGIDQMDQSVFPSDHIGVREFLIRAFFKGVDAGPEEAFIGGNGQLKRFTAVPAVIEGQEDAAFGQRQRIHG